MAAKKSGGIKVSLGKLSEDVIELVVKRGGTLRDALLQAEYDEDTLDETVDSVRVNGKPAKLNTKLHSGDFILILSNVQGGIR